MQHRSIFLYSFLVAACGGTDFSSASRGTLDGGPKGGGGSQETGGANGDTGGSGGLSSSGGSGGKGGSVGGSVGSTGGSGGVSSGGSGGGSSDDGGSTGGAVNASGGAGGSSGAGGSGGAAACFDACFSDCAGRVGTCCLGSCTTLCDQQCGIGTGTGGVSSSSGGATSSGGTGGVSCDLSSCGGGFCPPGFACLADSSGVCLCRSSGSSGSGGTTSTGGATSTGGKPSTGGSSGDVCASCHCPTGFTATPANGQCYCHITGDTIACQ